MAKSEDLTISYREIMSIPFAARQTLTNSNSLMDSISKQLTPGQRASLFPSYYKDEVKTSSTGGGGGGARPSDLNALNKSPALSPYLSSVPATSPAKVGQQKSPDALTGNPPSSQLTPGKKGAYRPVYELSDADLTDDVINTIAGEARLSDQRSLDGVVNNMLNRVGTKGWGPSGNLHEVARAPGQYTGYRKATPEEAAMIRQRIRDIATGSIPDPTNGSDAYRARSYLEGRGKGKTFYKLATAQGFNDVGGNVYAKDPNVEPGPYASYSPEQVEANLEKTQETAGATATPVNFESSTTPETKTASELSAEQYASSANIVPSEQEMKLRPIEDPIGYLQNKNPRGADIDHVDPVLLKSYAEAVQQFEADNPGYQVEVFGEQSGVRHSGSTHNHGIQPGTGKGGAMDFVIVDKKTGQQITNYNKPYPGQIGTPGQAAPLYAKLHSAAALAQAYYAPDSPAITFGGSFVSDNAMDLMHGDVTHPHGASGYNFESGFSEAQMKKWSIPENVALGSAEAKAKLAQQIYGRLDKNGNYTNRMAAVRDDTTNTTTFAAAGLSLEEKANVQTAAVVNDNKQQAAAAATAPTNATTQAATPEGGTVIPEPIIAMAEGGMIHKPYLANPLDGKGPKVLMGEKGSEAVVPQKRIAANELGSESVSSQMSMITNTSQERHQNPQPSFDAESSKKDAVAKITQVVPGNKPGYSVSTNHRPPPASLQKAMAYAVGSSTESILVQSPIGTAYRHFGYKNSTA